MARIAKELNDNLVGKAAQIVKKLGDAKDSAKFDALESALKVARPMAAKYLYAAEAKLDPSLKFKLTYKNIVSARSRGLRWERIAAYTGTSVPQVQAEFIEGGGDLSKSYVGKGRLPSGVKPEAKKASKASNGKSTKAAAAQAKAKADKSKGKAAKGAKIRKRSQLAASRP